MANVHGNCSTKQWHMQQEDQGQWIEPKRVRERQRQRRRFQVATNCASFFAPHENEACSNAAARTHPRHSWRGTSNITSHWTSDLVVSNVQHSTFNIITWAEHVLNMSHRAITSSKLKKTPKSNLFLMQSSVAMMKNWFIIKISEQPNNGQNKPLAHDATATATATASGQLCCCCCCSCSCIFRTHLNPQSRQTQNSNRHPLSAIRHPPPADCNSTTSTTFSLSCLCKSVKQQQKISPALSFFSYFLAILKLLKLHL